MNEQTHIQPPPPPAPSTSGIDFGAILTRALDVLKNPKGIWSTIKSEGKSVGDIYMPFLVFIALLKPIGGFVQSVIVGATNPITGETIRAGVFGGLVSQVVGYAIMLGFAYVAAMIIEKLSPMFQGNCSLADAFALVAYSSTAGCVGAGLGIIPMSLFAFIGGLFGLYGIYIFWTGIEPMTGVPAAKKIPFFAVYVITIFVLMMIFTAITAALFGFGLFMA